MQRIIALADDSVTVRKAAEMLLTKDPHFAVRTFGSGEALIAHVKQEPPSVIVVDHALADKNAYDVAATLKALPATEHVPVLVLVGPMTPYDTERATASGTVGYISKPFDTAHFLEGIRAALRHSEDRKSATVTVSNAPTLGADMLPPSIPAAFAQPKPSLAPAEPLFPLELPAHAVVQQHIQTPVATSPVNADSSAILQAMPKEELVALVRKVVEEIVWEVVPDMAETLIKEEISRLIKN